MSALHSLYKRWQVLVHELAKFGIVGAINTALDFGLANLLHLGLGTDQYLAKAISVSVAATSSYFMNRHWTFRHRARTGLGREYTLFFVLNGVGLAIAEACIWIVRVPLHKEGALWFNIAQVAGLAIGMLFRFATYKRWVFIQPELQPELGGSAGTVPRPEAPQADAMVAAEPPDGSRAAEAFAEGSIAGVAEIAEAGVEPEQATATVPVNGNGDRAQNGNGQVQPSASGQPAVSRTRASS